MFKAVASTPLPLSCSKYCWLPRSENSHKVNETTLPSKRALTWQVNILFFAFSKCRHVLSSVPTRRTRSHWLSLSPAVAARLDPERIPRMPGSPASSTPRKFQEVVLEAPEEAGTWESVSKKTSIWRGCKDCPRLTALVRLPFKDRDEGVGG